MYLWSWESSFGAVLHQWAPNSEPLILVNLSKLVSLSGAIRSCRGRRVGNGSRWGAGSGKSSCPSMEVQEVCVTSNDMPGFEGKHLGCFFFVPVFSF